MRILPHLPQDCSPLTHEIDHIIARKHEGPTKSENLALACYFCNTYKGPNIAGVDPVSGQIVRLFHPRKDRWNRHFSWKFPLLIGRTGVGRATIAVLEINHDEILGLRDALFSEGRFPP